MATLDVSKFDLSTITLRSLRDLEAELKKPIGALFAALAGGDMSALTADLMAGLFWLRLRADDPEVTFEAVLDMDLGGLNPEGPKVPAGPTSVTGITVRLSRAWGCSPVALRDLTMGELAEMGAVLADEARRR